jgi:hypothetical protein
MPSNSGDQQAICRTNRKHVRDVFRQPSRDGNIVEMTIPEKPDNPLQKYRWTETGSMALKKSRAPSCSEHVAPSSNDLTQ